MDRINNKVMNAGTLKSEFQIPLNVDDNTRILTLLDVDALHVFELGQVGKLELSDSQIQQLKLGSNKSNVPHCSAEIIQALPAEAQKDCVMILRYDVPVSYVRPELPVVDYDGNQDARIQFKPVRSGQQIGLVQIEQNVQPRKVESNNEMDPRTTVKIADIKGKQTSSPPRLIETDSMILWFFHSAHSKSISCSLSLLSCLHPCIAKRLQTREQLMQVNRLDPLNRAIAKDLESFEYT